GRRSPDPPRSPRAGPSPRRDTPRDWPSRDAAPAPRDGAPLREGAPRDGAPRGGGAPRDGAPARGGRPDGAASRSPRYAGRPGRDAPPAPVGRADPDVRAPGAGERAGRAELERSPDPARAPEGGRRLGPPLELRAGRAPRF